MELLQQHHRVYITAHVKVYHKENKKIKRINQYIFGKKIGTGAVAKVKEAFDVKTNKKVAIKIVKKKVIKTLS